MKAIIRKDEQAVSPVIATILMVAITVVLAAVLYVMVSGLLTGPGPTKPFVTFSTAQLVQGNATMSVAQVSQTVSPSNYRLNLQVGASTGAAQAMPSSGSYASITIGGTTYRIWWTDIGGEGTLNAGDTFRVTGDNVALPSNSSFTLYLLWSDGAQIQTVAWNTP